MQWEIIYNSSQFRTFVRVLIKQQMMYFLAYLQFKLGIQICMHCSTILFMRWSKAPESFIFLILHGKKEK